MPTLKWSDGPLLWVKNADQQRQYLIELLDKAYMETARGDVIENLAVIIDRLTDYATEHFYYVEHMMSISANLVEHREKHKAFMDRVGDLQISYYCASRPVSLQVLSFLINWLTHHKLRIDADRQAEV